MPSQKGRVLLIDDNPIRLTHAATELIVAGFSVLPLSTFELSGMLASRTQRWQIDVALVRVTLDTTLENLLSERFGDVPIGKLGATGIFDANLASVVAQLLRGDATAA